MNWGIYFSIVSASSPICMCAGNSKRAEPHDSRERKAHWRIQAHTYKAGRIYQSKICTEDKGRFAKGRKMENIKLKKAVGNRYIHTKSNPSKTYKIHHGKKRSKEIAIEDTRVRKKKKTTLPHHLFIFGVPTHRCNDKSADLCLPSSLQTHCT